jgi:hypothetical protein
MAIKPGARQDSKREVPIWDSGIIAHFKSELKFKRLAFFSWLSGGA